MTIAPPCYTHNRTLNGGSFQNTQQAVVARRSSLQENMLMSGTGCIVPRRSSLASISKTKSFSSPSLVVVVDSHKHSDDICPGAQRNFNPCGNSDSFLQSADKRRRYQRRGSKTSFMMKISCKIDLPTEWQTPLAKAIKSVRVVDSSSSTLDDSSVHSQGTMSTTTSRFTHESRSSLKHEVGDNEMFSAKASRRHSTISLLASALELSRIEGQGIDMQQA